jgi:Cft2 family RNA processing exonuclease
MGSFQEHGQQLGIGASAGVIKEAGKTIVIDWGVGFERTGQINLQYAPAGEYLKGECVDLFIITHSHIDHVGAAARFVAEHPEAIVIISRKALEAAEIMLWDSLKIMRSQGMEDGDADKIFTAEDLVQFMNCPDLILDESGWYDGILPGWDIGLHWSGHDLGAIMVLLVPPSGRPILLTGDISSHDQEIVPGVMLPSREFLGDFLERPGITMITEATNGAKPMAKPRRQVDNEFASALREVERRGGSVLCPTFAKNRASNIALKMVRAGIVPHVDGLARKLLMVEIPNIDQLLKEGRIVFFEEDRDTASMHRHLLSQGQDPCGHEFSPVISPSATMDQGFVVEHALTTLPRHENALMFTGYMFEGSAAKQILEIERGRTVWLNMFRKGPTEVHVRCDVMHFDFSSHEYREGLIERVRLVRPETLIVNHCSDQAFSCLASGLAANPHVSCPNIYRGSHMTEIPLA